MSSLSAVLSKRFHPVQQCAVLAIMITVLSCSDSIAPDPDPAPVPTGEIPTGEIVPGEIVFSESSTIGYGIFIASSAGQRLRRISPEGSMEIDPAVSKDGTRIAYAGTTGLMDGSDWDIYVMNANGTNRVRLTQSAGPDDSPTWSPDGTRIAFTSSLDYAPHPHIYLVNPNGTGRTRLTNAEASDRAPEWSPDGKTILFDRYAGSENEGIFTMSPDGSNVVQLTSGHRDKDATWSPDGARIAFVRELPEGTELFVMNADGSAVTQLTFGAATVSDPAWSPDGTSVAFDILSNSRMCLGEDDDDPSFPCGHDLHRISLDGVIDSTWILTSAEEAAWHR